MTNRQAIAHLKKMLAKYSSGLVPSSKYQILTEARTFAKDHGISFPKESQQDLVNAAKQHLSAYIEWRQQGDS